MDMLSRRAALSGVAAMATAVAATSASCFLAKANPTGISLELARLIAAADEKDAAYRSYEAGVLALAERRFNAAKGADTETEARQRFEAANDHFDAMVSLCSDAQSAVAAFPVASARDLHAKVAFMIKHQMYDGMDWTNELLADAARLAKMEGRA